jgi:hypothetical protein
MENKPENPDAFPIINNGLVYESGMTLRDYFAAKVITGAWQTISPGSQSELAKRAYEIADAMLNQRKQ